MVPPLRPCGVIAITIITSTSYRYSIHWVLAMWPALSNNHPFINPVIETTLIISLMEDQESGMEDSLTQKVSNQAGYCSCLDLGSTHWTPGLSCFSKCGLLSGSYCATLIVGMISLVYSFIWERTKVLRIQVSCQLLRGRVTILPSIWPSSTLELLSPGHTPEGKLREGYKLRKCSQEAPRALP